MSPVPGWISIFSSAIIISRLWRSHILFSRRARDCVPKSPWQRDYIIISRLWRSHILSSRKTAGLRSKEPVADRLYHHFTPVAFLHFISP